MSLAAENRAHTIREIYKKVPYFSGEYPDQNLTFGKTTPASVEKILDNLTLFPKREILYDLGSGTGDVVIQAAYSGRVKKVVGIEVVQERYEASLIALNLARSVYNLPSAVEVSFINTDFRHANISDAQVVYMLATAYDKETMDMLEKKLLDLNKSARIIVCDQQLKNGAFKLIKTEDFITDYSKGKAYTYERT